MGVMGVKWGLLKFRGLFEEFLSLGGVNSGVYRVIRFEKNATLNLFISSKGKQQYRFKNTAMCYMPKAQRPYLDVATPLNN